MIRHFLVQPSNVQTGGRLQDLFACPVGTHILRGLKIGPGIPEDEACLIGKFFLMNQWKSMDLAITLILVCSDRWFDPHCVQKGVDVSDMKDKCAI